MPELLLFAFDHSTAVPKPSAARLAALPKVYDLITWQQDNWTWGDQELGHPWFRVLQWPQAVAADLNSLLVYVNASSGNLAQYRQYYLDLSPGNSHLPGGLHNWHADNSRAQPKFLVPNNSSMTVANSRAARSLSLNPHYIGPDLHRIG